MGEKNPKWKFIFTLLYFYQHLFMFVIKGEIVGLWFLINDDKHYIGPFNLFVEVFQEIDENIMLNNRLSPYKQ